MLEAQIICCADSVPIPDLGLQLSRGEELWISAAQARSSRDLQNAKGAGKVRLYYRVRDRSRTQRHAPPNFQRMRPTPRVVTEPAPPPTEAAANPAALVEEIKAGLLAGLRETIAEEVQKAMSGGSKPSESMNAQQMAQVLEQVLSRHVPAAQTGGVVIPSRGKSPAESADDVPLYLPSGIVDKDAKTAISIQEKTDDSAEDLDETARLLREMRRNRKNGDT